MTDWYLKCACCDLNVIVVWFYRIENLFILQYVSLSKRYIPEVINFLHGILFLASTKNTKKGEANYDVCKCEMFGVLFTRRWNMISVCCHTADTFNVYNKMV